MRGWSGVVKLLPEGFFRPVEYAARTTYRRPPGFYRRLQSAAPVFSALGLTPNYVVRLEVRNVRAAHGHVVLRDDRQRYAARLTEVPVSERAEVIRAYIHRPSPRGRPMVRTGEARHYFGIEPDATPAQIAAVATNYPVFRVDRVRWSPPADSRPGEVA